MDEPRRRLVRFLAALGAVAVALAYVLIGLDVITVVDDQAAADPTPLFVAAALFAALAALLVTWSPRPVLAAGAVLQLVVIFGYLLISTERSPAFEAWGLGVKALQVALFVALLALILQRAPSAQERSPTGGQRA